MDPTTASYYRAMLFGDTEDSRPLPPSLCKLHTWAISRFQRIGCGSVISRQAAFNVALIWMSSTKEGREFAAESTSLGELFEESQPFFADGDVNWAEVKQETPVIVMIEGKPTPATFMGWRSSWIDVVIEGHKKHFRRDKVQLAGV